MSKSPYGVASFQQMSGMMHTEFIQNLAISKGFHLAEIEESLGRYTKGKHKGKLRGVLHWYKVTGAGWIHQLNCVFTQRYGTFGYKITDYTGNVAYRKDGTPLSTYGDVKESDDLIAALTVYMEQLRN